MTTRLFRTRGLVPHAATLVLQAVVLGFFGGSRAAFAGFPLDDAWIHQVVARTFATTGTLGYLPGHHGAGATSYLWATLLAANFRLLHVDPVVFTHALNIVFCLAAGQFLLALFLRARPDEQDPRTWALVSMLVTGLATLGGNFVWYAFSGMEATLFAALSIAAILEWTTTQGNSQRAALLAGLASGALALTRPEGALLGPLLAAVGLRARRPRGEILRLAAPWSAAIALYVGSNLVATGSALPATLGGRQWLWFESSGLGRPALVAQFVTTWLERLRNYTLGTSSNLAFWIAAGCFALGVVRVVRGRDAGLKLLLAWTLAHLAVYAVLLPTPGHGARYQPLTPLVYLALVGLGAADLLASLVRALGGGHASRIKLVAASVAGVAPWVALVAIGLRDWRDDHTKAVAHIRATEVGLGPVIDALPAGARVASFDIGACGFFAHRPLVDLGGLVDASVVPLMKEGRIWEYLRDQSIDYVVLPSGYEPLGFPDRLHFGQRLRLIDNPALRLTLARVLETEAPIWGPGIASTWNAAPRQMVFQVAYTGEQGPLAQPPPRPGGVLEDPNGLLEDLDREAVTNGLAVLAGYGVKVRIRVGPRDDATASPDEWLVRFGPWGGDVEPPKGSPVPAAAATSLLVEWLEYYVDAEDWGGAARIALYAVAAAQRRFVDGRFLPLLPPADGVKLAASTPETTWSWGLVLAAGLLLLGGIAFRRGLGRLGAVAVAALALVACARRLPEVAVDGDAALAAQLENGHVDVDERSGGKTALHVAAEHADARSIRVLLAHHADVGALDPNGNPALTISAASGCVACVDELLAGGADPNQSNPRTGLRPLHWAVLYGTPQTMDRLVRGGADPNGTNLRGETALHLAANLDPTRSFAAAQVLYRDGADLLAPENGGFTPLHVAAFRDDVAIVRVYRDAKVDLDVQSGWGKTALDVALERESDAVAEALFAAGAHSHLMPPIPPLFEAARTNDVPRMSRILATGPDLEQVYEGRTVREVARESGSEEALKLLGPAPTARDGKH